MAWMIGNAKNLFEGSSNAPGCPFFTDKSKGFCPTIYEFGYLGELLVGQQRPLARCRMAAQGLSPSTLANLLEPPADRPLTNSQFLRNLSLRPTLLVKRPRLQSAAFTPIERLVLRLVVG